MSSNHNQSLDVALKIVDIAAKFNKTKILNTIIEETKTQLTAKSRDTDYYKLNAFVQLLLNKIFPQAISPMNTFNLIIELRKNPQLTFQEMMVILGFDVTKINVSNISKSFKTITTFILSIPASSLEAGKTIITGLPKLIESFSYIDAINEDLRLRYEIMDKQLKLYLNNPTQVKLVQAQLARNLPTPILDNITAGLMTNKSPDLDYLYQLMYVENQVQNFLNGIVEGDKTTTYNAEIASINKCIEKNPGRNVGHIPWCETFADPVSKLACKYVGNGNYYLPKHNTDPNSINARTPFFNHIKANSNYMTLQTDKQTYIDSLNEQGVAQGGRRARFANTRKQSYVKKYKHKSYKNRMIYKKNRMNTTHKRTPYKTTVRRHRMVRRKI